jgi:hypothetical protein
LAADVHHLAADTSGFGAAADAIVGFEHNDGVTSRAQAARGCEASETGADNGDVDLVGAAGFVSGGGERGETGKARAHAEGGTARWAGVLMH